MSTKNSKEQSSNNSINDSQIDLDYDLDEMPKRTRIMNPKQSQKIYFILLASSAVFIFGVFLTIIIMIIVNGFRGMSWELLFADPGLEVEFSIKAAIFGTFLLITCSVLIALPLGLSAAIYLNEYAREGIIVNIINQGINNLAGVPSIVFGLFGYAFFSLVLGFGKSLWAGMCTLACMMLPTIIRASQEALRNVPDEYREGSFALGSTKWQTIRWVVLPSATPGIVTGVILALGRAAGETAAILFAGAAIVPKFLGFSGRFGALPVYLYMKTVNMISTNPYLLWACALVLLVVVFSFNAIAYIIRSRTEHRAKHY
ncbi:MAG: phosphate ABC transporter permease PstA [Asgard group archaeon]|nr:phosphate ABC transporter permease PstA [Asgard group archaeon]